LNRHALILIHLKYGSARARHKQEPIRQHWMKHWLPPSEPASSVRFRLPVGSKRPDQHRLPALPRVARNTPVQPIPSIRPARGPVLPVPRWHTRRIRPTLALHVEVVAIGKRRLIVRYQITAELRLLLRNKRVINNVSQFRVESLRRTVHGPGMQSSSSSLLPKRSIRSGRRRRRWRRRSPAR